MDLKIHSIVNAKTPSEEIVWLVASSDVNLKGYALVDRTFDKDGDVSNEFRHIFIFPDLKISKGDFVKLCTGEGKYSKSVTTGGIPIHKLYWQASSCVWNDKGGDTASLIKYEPIHSKIVPAVKTK